jgi:hypothetical protein
MPLDVQDLLDMPQEELEKLFRRSPAGEIPNGKAHGTVLVAPGTNLSHPAARLLHLVAWKGKVFDREKGELRNEVGPFGRKAVRAKVYKGESWLDGKEAIILDYSKTSLVARWIRDEIREVAPQLYLGLVFWERAKIVHFALKLGE